MTKRLAALLLVAASFTLLVVASALGGPADGPPGVSAVVAGGQRLGANPALRPGTVVVVTVRGFAARAVVTVGLVGAPVLGRVPADARGTVGYRYAVPRTLPAGAHALVFSGPAGGRSGRPPAGTVRALVPLTRRWPFRTPGHPVGGSASSPPGGGGASGAASGGVGSGHGSGGGATAVTGADVLGLAGLALLAVAAGVALVRTVRHRSPLPRL